MLDSEPENASLLRENLAENATAFGPGLAKHPTVKQPATLDDQARYDVVEAVQVPIVALTDLLRQYPTINAIKMDIEGAEIPLLESLDGRRRRWARW